MMIGVYWDGKAGATYVLVPEAVRNISTMCQFVELSCEMITAGE